MKITAAVVLARSAPFEIETLDLGYPRFLIETQAHPSSHITKHTAPAQMLRHSRDAESQDRDQYRSAKLYGLRPR